MKAAFALLANTEVHNLVRKLSWELHRKYQIGIASLPPHISLKQPFRIIDLSALETYMGELAESISPFDVTLTEIQIVPFTYNSIEYGILWMDVQETEALRGLHNRLNDELNQRFGNTAADFDGVGYHFHMTIMMGGKPIDEYRKFYNEISNLKINKQFTVNELAMFVYDEPLGPEGEYLCYRILPLGKSPS